MADQLRVELRPELLSVTFRRLFVADVNVPDEGGVGARLVHVADLAGVEALEKIFG